MKFTQHIYHIVQEYTNSETNGNIHLSKDEFVDFLYGLSKFGKSTDLKLYTKEPSDIGDEFKFELLEFGSKDPNNEDRIENFLELSNKMIQSPGNEDNEHLISLLLKPETANTKLKDKWIALMEYEWRGNRTLLLTYRNFPLLIN